MDFPKFEPVSDLPSLTESEMEFLFANNDPCITDARARCSLGNVSAVPIIADLAKRGNSNILQICLPDAVRSRNTNLVRQLLRMGARVDNNAAQLAILAGQLNMLSLFIQYGWEINRNLEWCSPPPLSSVQHSPYELRN